MIKDYIYFNNAAAAYPLCPGVTDAVVKAMLKPANTPGRGSGGEDFVKNCRIAASDMLSADLNETVLTSGATYGLNAAISGLGLKQGDTVITSVFEHNSVLRPLNYLEENAGTKTLYISVDKDFNLDINKYEKLLKQKPKLVVLTHASNVTGRIIPVKQIFNAAKAAGAVTLLDASQTAGRISVKPREMNADIVAFPGYKGLRGPHGTGILYVSKSIELRPVFSGGTGVKSDLRLMPHEMPMKLEPGTPNVSGFGGLAVAVRYYSAHQEDIAKKESEITRRMMTGLLKIPGIKVFDDNPYERLPVISFAFDNID